MIKKILQQIQSDVHSRASGREVKINGVTKTVNAGRIEDAHRAGLRIFGENRIQEALPKMEALSNLDLQWHFIGHLQSNKAKEAIRHFIWIHSIDSVKLLLKVDQEASRLEKRINVLLEVNLADEHTKYGFQPQELEGALGETDRLQAAKVCGFMIIPPFHDDPEQTRPYFRKLKELRDQFARQYPDLKELSMGMSHDYKVAIEEGATMIRIGTLLFGERS